MPEEDLVAPYKGPARGWVSVSSRQTSESGRCDWLLSPLITWNAEQQGKMLGWLQEQELQDSVAGTLSGHHKSPLLGRHEHAGRQCQMYCTAAAADQNHQDEQARKRCWAYRQSAALYKSEPSAWAFML